MIEKSGQGRLITLPAEKTTPAAPVLRRGNQPTTQRSRFDTYPIFH
jgi:hypothetical protein